MVFYIAVRVSRRTRNVIGSKDGQQDMLWIESPDPVPRDRAGSSGRQVSASSREAKETSQVHWYRLPGRTYVSG